MTTKTRLKRMGAILIAFLLGISCAAMTAFARGSIDTGRTASLSVYFGADGKGFPGVEFSIYRVASVSASGEYTLTGNFQRYRVSFEDLDSSGWRALAQTLEAYAARDGISPLTARKTGTNGWAYFNGLSTGLYLVTGAQYEKDGTVYTTQPMLVSLPGLSADDEWDYDVDALCKFDSNDTPEEPVSRKVQKVWADDGNRSKRPERITVQLLENGKVVDTVILSQANNWEYTWEDLDGASRWQVVEKDVPEGYTVSVTQEGIVFVMTNTYPSKNPPKLPQTGMLWWPVPILACGGLFMITVGVLVRRKRGDEDET